MRSRSGTKIDAWGTPEKTDTEKVYNHSIRCPVEEYRVKKEYMVSVSEWQCMVLCATENEKQSGCISIFGSNWYVGSVNIVTRLLLPLLP